MPWRLVNGNYEFFSQRIVVTSPSSTAGKSTSREASGESGIEHGTFVQHSGIASSTIGSFDHGNSVLNAETHLEKAEPRTPLCAGVVTNITDVSGVTTYGVKESGIVLAWVIQEKKRKLPLSGIYNTSLNGIPNGKTAILVEGDSFIMCRSRDDQVETLTEKFASLTGT